MRMDRVRVRKSGTLWLVYAPYQSKATYAGAWRTWEMAMRHAWGIVAHRR
jgi:hypothetical protein